MGERMKKKMSVFVTMAVLAVCFPMYASAEGGKGLYAVGKAGAFFPIESDGDTGFAGDIGVGYNFLSGPGLLGLEASIGYYNSSYGAEKAFDYPDMPSIHRSIDVDADMIPFSVTVKGGRRVGPWSFYAGAGLDLIYVSYDVSTTASTPILGTIPGDSGDDSDVDFGAHLAAGATYDMTDNLFVGFECRYLLAGDLSITTGLDTTKFDFSGFTAQGMIGVRF